MDKKLELYNNENKKSIDVISVIIDNKQIIYPVLFYISGLIIGSCCYNLLDNSTLSLLIEEIAKGSSGGFLNLFLNNLTVYVISFLFCVILGLCIIGFQLVNLVPLICGIEIAIKLSYYYTNYGPKGIGYSLLIIIPGVVLFISVIIFTIELSNIISKYIFNLATKKSGIIREFNLKSYLIRFALYLVLIVIISALSALSNFLLSSLISL